MDPLLRRRVLMVLSAAATATALGGFFSGLSERPQPSRTWPLFVSRPVVGRVPTYAQERERHHPNRLRHAGALVAMAAQRPGVLDPVPPLDDARRAEALDRRAQRRAYDGAPPTTRHGEPGTQVAAAVVKKPTERPWWRRSATTRSRRTAA